MPLDTSHIFNRRYTSALTGIFLFLELMLYSMYLSLDILSNHSILLSDIFKYTGIFLCFCFTAIIYRLSPGAAIGSRPDKWLLLAALFVLFSDYYLLFTDSYLKGVLIFCIVQCFYALYLTPAKLEAFITGSALISAAAVLLIHHFFNTGGILLYTSLLYIFMLLKNIGQALKKAKRTSAKPELLFAFGLILYFLCDMNVGIMNLPRLYPNFVSGPLQLLKSGIFEYISTFSMWFFYLPAQVLIAMSIVWPLLWHQTDHSPLGIPAKGFQSR